MHLVSRTYLENKEANLIALLPMTWKQAKDTLCYNGCDEEFARKFLFMCLKRKTVQRKNGLLVPGIER